MQFKGTAHRYGRDIDTDVIIPARYLTSPIRRSWRSTPWMDLDCVVRRTRAARRHHRGRRNFGCGSSREHYPHRHQGGGRRRRHRQELRAHLLPQLHQHGPRHHGVPEAVGAISQGDVVSGGCRYRASSWTDDRPDICQAQPFPVHPREIIEAGGLINRTEAEAWRG